MKLIDLARSSPGDENDCTIIGSAKATADAAIAIGALLGWLLAGRAKGASSLPQGKPVHIHSFGGERDCGGRGGFPYLRSHEARVSLRPIHGPTQGPIHGMTA